MVKLFCRVEWRLTSKQAVVFSLIFDMYILMAADTCGSGIQKSSRRRFSWKKKPTMAWYYITEVVVDTEVIMSAVPRYDCQQTKIARICQLCSRSTQSSGQEVLSKGDRYRNLGQQPNWESGACAFRHPVRQRGVPTDVCGNQELRGRT